MCYQITAFISLSYESRLWDTLCVTLRVKVEKRTRENAKCRSAVGLLPEEIGYHSKRGRENERKMAIEPDDIGTGNRDHPYMDHLGSAGRDLLHGAVGDSARSTLL